MRTFRIGALAVAITLLTTACSGDGSTDDQPSADQSDAAAGDDVDAGGDDDAGDGEKVTIALANSFIGNQWRGEMANVFEAACAMEPYKSEVECSVFHSGEDVGKQTQQITNLISQGVDAIALNPGSPTGLNSVVKQACDQGIVVVSFDATVTEECASSVNVDQHAIGRDMAEWLVEAMGGSGKVIMVTGVAGTSVDQDRNAGAKEVFEEAGVEIVAEYSANWDSATAQRETAAALPTLPEQIDGIWASGGTDGVLKAFQDAGRELPPTAGESENGFRKMMAEGLVEGFSTGTPPFLSVMALEYARAIVRGEAEPGNILIPHPIVLNDGVEEGATVFADQPDSFFNTFTDSGEDAAVVLCIEAALDATPCEGELTVRLG